MQKYCFELTERLLKSLDKEYNVVDMGAVVEVITALEKTTITKEVLEFTRLGKYINELRRKTSNDALAKRAKDLVRRWRDMVLPSAHTTPQPTPADTAPVALNGAKPQSPALRCLKPQSPALRGLKPQSPLVKDTTPLRVLSPALSVHSERSHSPHATPNKATTNHRSNLDESPKLGPAIQNHVTEAVPRTHSSNKRLRKDDSENVHSTTRTPGEPFTKRQRLNGENLNSSLNSQVPSPLSKERIPEKSAEPEVVESEVVPTGPKKRGRKKGSKSVKKQQMVEDHVKEKLASISRNPKLKTTQELLADLQARGSNSNSIVTSSQGNKKEPPSTEDVLRSNNEHVTKYLQSQNDILRGSIGDVALQTRLKSNDNDRKVSRYRDSGGGGGGGGGGDNVLNLKSRESPTRTPRDLTVAEILAKLPPLDLNSIVWSDREEEQEEDDSVVKDCPPVEITPEDLEILHTQHVEGLNGNFQPKLSSLTLNVENDNNEVSNVTDLTDRVATSQSDLSSNDSKKQDNAATLSDVTRQDTNLQNSDNKNGSQKDREFREWHQMLARPSYDDQTLHILPYVIID